MKNDFPAPSPEDEPGAASRQLASLYARWRRPLAAMMRRYFDAPEAAEDAAQEVFTRIAAAGKVLPPEEERPYLTQSARSMAGEAWRKNPARHGIKVVAADDCESDMHAVAADAAANPERQLEHRQRLARLHEAIAELPQRQREAFVAHRVEGRTVEETAALMGISVRMTVKHLSRALSYCQARVLYSNAAQMRARHIERSGADEEAAAPREEQA